MKAASDPRHQKRRHTVRQLFAVTFNSHQQISDQARDVLANQNKTDALITKHAPEWPLDKLNKVDLAILRLAVYELVIEKKEPLKVVIDEAVELAKEMGSESSSAFVNGVLGSIVKEELEATNGK